MPTTLRVQGLGLRASSPLPEKGRRATITMATVKGGPLQLGVRFGKGMRGSRISERGGHYIPNILKSPQNGSPNFKVSKH